MKICCNVCIVKAIVPTWELHEQPKAYIRAGDSEPLLQGFRNAKCEVSIHPFGYRSILYLLKFKPDKHTYIAELQIRTIFEEGWSEIDHCVRYPRQSDDTYLADFLAIFNRLAGSADEMGSFIKTLGVFTASEAQKIAELKTNVLEKEAALEKAISELTINQSEKDKLKKIVDDLRKLSQSTHNQAYLSTIAPTLSLSNFAAVQSTNLDFLKTQPHTIPHSLLGGLSSSYAIGKKDGEKVLQMHFGLAR